MKKPNQPKVLCIGEAMLELSLNDHDNAVGTNNANVNFAGDTLNTAIYLRRLGNAGTHIAFCTVVGQDALSTRLIDFIRAENLIVDSIQRTSERTIGLYAINTDRQGERSFTYWRNQSAARLLFQSGNNLDFSVLENADVIYLSAITLAILPAEVRANLHKKLQALQEQNSIQFAFDSNYRPALWESQSVAQSSVASFWEITDIALPSIDDEMDLFGDKDEASVLKRFTSYGITQGALKRGAVGPVSLCGNSHTLPSEKLTAIDAVDTTAAGDSFNAGYLSALIQGATNTEALLAGHQCAARVIMHRGAIIPLADW